ncbi:MAG: TonB-dependent receptor [Bacteroidota bacterium]
MRLLLSSLLLFVVHFAVGQNRVELTGWLLDAASKVPLENVRVAIEGEVKETYSDNKGFFALKIPVGFDGILNLSKKDYQTKRIPLDLIENDLDFGNIFLEKDVTQELTDNLITLTDTELLDENEADVFSGGLLQASQDIFLRRAAFDFGQAFFKVRGYDSGYSRVFLNGIPMNQLFNGRPQWSQWGGLNDVMRNQTYVHGIAHNPIGINQLLGGTAINTRPSEMREGIRISSSLSNRTYTGRAMTTYVAENAQGNLAYAISGSRRWAKEGFISGTPYDAWSFFGAVEYALNRANSVLLTSIFSKNRRGRSSAITEEVFEAMGRSYNPNWGFQDGEIRNARENRLFKPILMLNHWFTSEKISVSSGLMYQFGKDARSRLGYYNAPNPDPTYYRYLPSFQINSPIGANFIAAEKAEEGFSEQAQISWQRLYQANQNSPSGQAAYLLYDDVSEDRIMAFNTMFELQPLPKTDISGGLRYRRENTQNYALIQDLLGATFHEDIDVFSETQNDLNGPLQKGEGDIFNYHYDIASSRFDSFLQGQYTAKNWMGFLGFGLTTLSSQRSGLFENERFPSSSLGEGEKIGISTVSVKGGGRYFLTGRHFFEANVGRLQTPPALQNLYINPRENQLQIDQPQPENITTVDLGYHFRLPKLTGRVTAYYTRFQNGTDINFFFVDSGLGSDFVQEAVTDLDRLHKGIELGIEYAFSPTTTFSLAANLGEYVYANTPEIEINFDPSGDPETLIDASGNKNLGFADIKGLRLSQGPQTAISLGTSYRDPKYWWLGLTANYLENNFASFSTINRTDSFALDPETGLPFAAATPENMGNLLAQKPLENMYLLNLVGGKSWYLQKKYVSVFISINNLFDTVFRSGGYEQSRNGNYAQLAADNLSGSPSFGPKYWYGFGRTYFLNLAVSL